jgi:hypothetical protein
MKNSTPVVSNSLSYIHHYDSSARRAADAMGLDLIAPQEVYALARIYEGDRRGSNPRPSEPQIAEKHPRTVATELRGAQKNAGEGGLQYGCIMAREEAHAAIIPPGRGLTAYRPFLVSSPKHGPFGIAPSCAPDVSYYRYVRRNGRLTRALLRPARERRFAKL